MILFWIIRKKSDNFEKIQKFTCNYLNGFENKWKLGTGKRGNGKPLSKCTKPLRTTNKN